MHFAPWADWCGVSWISYVRDNTLTGCSIQFILHIPVFIWCLSCRSCRGLSWSFSRGLARFLRGCISRHSSSSLGNGGGSQICHGLCRGVLGSIRSSFGLRLLKGWGLLHGLFRLGSFNRQLRPGILNQCPLALLSLLSLQQFLVFRLINLVHVVVRQEGGDDGPATESLACQCNLRLVCLIYCHVLHKDRTNSGSDWVP
mmetsp:Transcript_108929/g.188521  ORF Transcript_108929/g.188521 Transcript_108929/m.188521 type:complete len:200 (-) Transcript_108929:1818-2417(-)